MPTFWVCKISQFVTYLTGKFLCSYFHIYIFFGKFISAQRKAIFQYKHGHNPVYMIAK